MNSDYRNRLNIRDLVTIGIFNAIAIVCYALTVALSCTTVIGLFFSTAAAFLVLGTIYMLIVVKVRKKGTYLLCGIIMSFVGLIGGRIYTTIGCIAAGIIAEILVGKYNDFKRIAVAYGGYAAVVAMGIYLPGFLMGVNYLLQRGANKGMTAETVQAYAGFFNPQFLGIVLGLNILSALIGALIGRKILNKHFVKAGIVRG